MAMRLEHLDVIIHQAVCCYLKSDKDRVHPLTFKKGKLKNYNDHRLGPQPMVYVNGLGWRCVNNLIFKMPSGEFVR